MTDTPRFIREEECKLITGLSRSTRWRLEKEGKFPQHRKLGASAVGWLLSEIKEWIDQRPKV